MWLTDIPYKLPELRTVNFDAPTTVCYLSHITTSPHKLWGVDAEVTKRLHAMKEDLCGDVHRFAENG